MENFAAVNWIAVVVGTVVSFLLGWLWYSPKFFGVKWAEGCGVNLGNASAMPVVAMVLQLVALFILACVVGITATTDSLYTAILSIVAAAAFVAASGAFVKKSRYAINVEFFYIIASGFVMITCQGIFRALTSA